MSFLRRNSKKVLAALVGLVLLGLFVRSKFAPKDVMATVVVRGQAIEAVYATGTVEARDRLFVKAKQNGTLDAVFVKEGARVKKGDLLARIDNPTVAFDLKRGKVDLFAANQQAGQAPHIAALKAQQQSLESERELIKRQFARVEQLYKEKAVPHAEYDAARTRLDQVDAQILGIQAQQKAMRIDLNSAAQQKAAVVDSLASRVLDTEVRAPQDGVVLAKLVEAGEVVSVNQSLFKIGDISNLVLEVLVDEADVARLHDGSLGDPSPVAIGLNAYPSESFRGRVYEVFPDANRERKSFTVKVAFEQVPLNLRSGMSGEVNIVVGKKEGVLLAPADAVSDGALWLVREGRIEKRPVKLGIRDLLRVEVMEGASEGDVVVTQGFSGLSDGSRAKAMLRPQDKAATVPIDGQPRSAL